MQRLKHLGIFSKVIRHGVFFHLGLVLLAMSPLSMGQAQPTPIIADELSDLPFADLLERIDQRPDDGPARLELAQREFKARRDASAAFNARQALATGTLETEQVAAARELLAALQRRRRWIVNFDASLAPTTSRQEFFDPDPANGTDEDVVLRTVNSGVGVTGFASVENRLRLSESVRLSSLVFSQGSVFTDSDFNAFFVTGRFGPLFLQSGDNRIGVRALAEGRWLGGDLDFEAYGGEAFFQRSIGTRFVGFGRVIVRAVDDSFDSQDGETYGLDGTVTRFGRQGRFERVFASAFRADFAASNQSFWFGRAGFGVFRETGFGLGVLVEPAISYQRFNGIDPIGQVAREDWRYGANLRIVKRDWRLFGISPFVALGVQRQESNVDVFDTTRTTVNAGLTRTF